MKFTKQLKLALFFVIIIVINIPVLSQNKGNKNVITEKREVMSFKGINAGGAIDVSIKTGEEQSVIIETDENLMKNIKTTVSDEILTIKSTGIKNPTKLNAIVTVPELTFVEAGGASNVKGDGLIKTKDFKVVAHGASSVSLEVDVDYLETIVSGASDLKLSGHATMHKTNVSGAGSLSAKKMVSEKCHYDISGAGDGDLYVTEEVKGETSGSGSVAVFGEPKISIEDNSGDSGNKTYELYAKDYYDSTKVKVAGLNIEVFESDDSVKVVIGNKVLHVDDNGNVRYSRCKKNKFNGHWAGFEMGLNGYFNNKNNMSFPKETEYMDLRMTKSWGIYVNFYEQNIPLSKNQKWGLVTGLGTSWNNYRFSKNTRLGDPDSSRLVGYIDKGISIRKSKLTTWYVNIPLLFEFQTNRYHNKNSFHLAAGMIMGVRISSHTKKYYNERNKKFDVTWYNPDTKQYEIVKQEESPNYAKTKQFEDFYLNPFKWDATVRIGWGIINLFATYSVNTMFKKEKGPELYPWTVGIAFANF